MYMVHSTRECYVYRENLVDINDTNILISM